MSELPEVGDEVEVTYRIVEPKYSDNFKTITITVDEVRPSSFIGGAGIGVRVMNNGNFFAPTSSDGYHADGKERMRIGIDAEWEVV